MLLLDQAALLLGMALTGQWNWGYLPAPVQYQRLRLSVQHDHGQKLVQRGAVCLCIPGAMLALLCPSWLDVPSWWTLINLHSVSIHALLVLYPVLLVAGGYRPSPRRVPQVLAFLFGSALPIYFLNQSLNTNFYFLNDPYGTSSPAPSRPCWAKKYYILGFLPATALALFLMYLPWGGGR